jgi:hypothetical protein
MRVWILSALLAAAAACAPSEPFETVLPADADATSAPGERGPLEVEASRRTIVDGEGRSVEALVYRPVTDDVFPPVVFVQGGFVSTERYGWAAEHLASRGAVVALPETTFDLALFSPDAAAIALGGLREDGETAPFTDGPGLVLGHSLGGVAAANAWQESDADGFLHLALLASIPDEARSFTDKDGARVVSVTGSEDAKLTPEEALAGEEQLPELVGAVVEGMNHYQWTDDATEGELDGDGTPTIDQADARRLGMTLIDELLTDLQGGTPTLLDDPTAWPTGLSPL